jgi:hypothetical protein
MAQKRARRRQGAAANDAAGTTGSTAAGREWPPSSHAPSRREIRPFIYAAFDLAMAVVYALLITQSPTRHAGHSLLLWSMVAAVLVAGAGMLWRSRWGWRAAVAGCVALLAVTVAILILILLSASFLAGVYGSMGRGAATVAILAGALAIEVCGLLPAFQLKFLLTRAGRRHYMRAAPAPSGGPAR